MEDRDFREILERCLEGAASGDEERRLIEAAEASPDRQRQLLDLAAFDAALKSFARKPDDLAQGAIASIGHCGKTRSFAKVVRTRLETEIPGRKHPLGWASGKPPVILGLVAAAFIALLIFFLMPPQPPKPLSKGRPATGNGEMLGGPAPEPPVRDVLFPKEPSLPPGPRSPGVSPSPFPAFPERTGAFPKKEEPGNPSWPPTPEPPPVPKPDRSREVRPKTVVEVATVDPSAAGRAFLLSQDPELPLDGVKALQPGQGLRTLDLPRSVVVRFPDGTRLEVGPDTEIRDIFPEEMLAAGPQGKRLGLLRGKLKAIVSKQPRGQPMSIETPHGTLRVLGTTLRIKVDPDPKRGTLLEVDEGKVEFRNISGRSVLVESGHFALAATGMELSAKPLSALKRLGAPCAILDPSFENQTSPGGGALVAPWSAEGPALIGVDETSGLNGTKCGFIFDGIASGSWSNIVQTVPVTPNTIYTLTCFIQTDATFRARGAAGVRTPGGSVIAQLPFGPLPEYTPLTIKFNSGLCHSVVIFAGFISNTGRRGNWIHVDEWNLTP